MLSWFSTLDPKAIFWATLRVYLLIGLILFVFQKRFIYFPSEQDFFDCPGFANYQTKQLKQTRFYYLPQSDKALVYFHGNAGSACDRSVIADMLEPLGYSLIFVEYAGYSNDSVSPNRDRLLANAADIAEFLGENQYQYTTAIGSSLGSAVAGYLTTLTKVDKLVLIAPFPSTTTVAQANYPIYPTGLLLTEKFNTQDYLQTYSGETLILHAAEDKVIPPHFSQELLESIPQATVQRALIPDTTHNTIFNSNHFYNKLSQFL